MKLHAAMLVICLGATVARADDKDTNKDTNKVTNSPGARIESTVTVNGRTRGTVTTYGADGKGKTVKVDRKATAKPREKDDGDEMTDPMDDHADLKQGGEGGSVSASGKTVKTKLGDKVQVINNVIYANGKKQ